MYIYKEKIDKYQYWFDKIGEYAYNKDAGLRSELEGG